MIKIAEYTYSLKASRQYLCIGVSLLLSLPGPRLRPRAYYGCELATSGVVPRSLVVAQIVAGQSALAEGVQHPQPQGDLWLPIPAHLRRHMMLKYQARAFKHNKNHTYLLSATD